MKSIIKQSNKKAAFTIVELLVVMSIIMILMGILLPAFNAAKRYARKVRQTAQFKSIDVGLELYRNEFESYPPSDGEDAPGTYNNYPGAMKLAEAMMGQDLLGFHPSSLFNKEGTDASGTIDLYPPDPPEPPTPEYLENLRARKGPYLQLESANPYTLVDLYGEGGYGTLGDPADPNGGIILCDEYKRTNRNTGDRKVSTISSPILYYKADVSSKLFDNTSIDAARQSIYNVTDNQELIDLGIAWRTTLPYVYPMASSGTDPDGNPASWQNFYKIITDEKVDVTPRPKMVDSYILISAGYDGLYGTDDDVFNFGD